MSKLRLESLPKQRLLLRRWFSRLGWSMPNEAKLDAFCAQIQIPTRSNQAMLAYEDAYTAAKRKLLLEGDLLWAMPITLPTQTHRDKKSDQSLSSHALLNQSLLDESFLPANDANPLNPSNKWVIKHLIGQINIEASAGMPADSSQNIASVLLLIRLCPCQRAWLWPIEVIVRRSKRLARESRHPSLARPYLPVLLINQPDTQQHLVLWVAGLGWLRFANNQPVEGVPVSNTNQRQSQLHILNSRWRRQLSRNFCHHGSKYHGSGRCILLDYSPVSVTLTFSYQQY